MYQPPTFNLIHFDDGAVEIQGRTATRWLSAWQGPRGEPAEQVTLGWAANERAQVVVATSAVQWLLHKADRRADAVFQAFGALQLQVPMPISATQVHEALEHARTVADFKPVELIGDGQVCTGAVRTIHDVLVGHARVGVRVATFAAVGLTIDQIRLQTLESADGYSIDPRVTQTTDDVDAHRPVFPTQD